MPTSLEDPVSVRSAQVKEETAQRAGDTEQNALPPIDLRCRTWVS